MKILVTGAAGFIGFHLTKRLTESGHTLVGLDNINDYYDVGLKYGRLEELGIARKSVGEAEYVKSALYPDFRFIKADLTDLDLLRKIMEENGFDKVCNLAAQAGVRYSFENPYSYIRSNLVGFHNLIDLSYRNKVKHFIYASSSSVYGNNAKVPFEESDRTDEPQSIYAATKKSNELIAWVYTSQLGLPATGLRFFTVYGPWGRPDMAPFLFLKSILEGKEIKVFNHGNLSRDFSYIDDIVTGVVKVIESQPADDRTGKVYNIGNSRPVRLMDFIGTIEKAAGREAVKKYVGMQKGDVYRTYANTAAIENDFNFKPDTPLEYGISEFCKWYRKYYGL